MNGNNNFHLDLLFNNMETDEIVRTFFANYLYNGRYNGIISLIQL